MPYLNEEEDKLVREYILLPYTKKLLERDLKVFLDGKTFKIERPYVKLVENALKQISQRLKVIKRRMFELGIKVHEKQRENLFVVFEWFCRGYNGEIRYNTFHLKNQVEGVIQGLFKDTIN